jgi:hypothetical protein
MEDGGGLELRMPCRVEFLQEQHIIGGRFPDAQDLAGAGLVRGHHAAGHLRLDEFPEPVLQIPRAEDRGRFLPSRAHALQELPGRLGFDLVHLVH